jgi:hypothetical protein
VYMLDFECRLYSGLFVVIMLADSFSVVFTIDGRGKN